MLFLALNFFSALKNFCMEELIFIHYGYQVWVLFLTLERVDALYTVSI